MNYFLDFNQSLIIPENTYNRCVEHLKVMNSWKFDLDETPWMKDKEGQFTVQDAFVDLLGKGFIRYYE